LNATPGASDDGPSPVLPPRRTLGPRRLVRSFGYAFAGLAYLLWREPNARIHAGAVLLVCALAAWLGFDAAEWALLVSLCGLVIGLEAMNTAVEGLADLVQPARDPRVRHLKDVAAGGVLAAALAAAAGGCFLFGPRLWRLLGG
jgi:diacylglycerol kinase